MFLTCSTGKCIIKILITYFDSSLKLLRTAMLFWISWSMLTWCSSYGWCSLLLIVEKFPTHQSQTLRWVVRWEFAFRSEYVKTTEYLQRCPNNSTVVVVQAAKWYSISSSNLVVLVDWEDATGWADPQPWYQKFRSSILIKIKEIFTLRGQSLSITFSTRFRKFSDS